MLYLLGFQNVHILDLLKILFLLMKVQSIGFYFFISFYLSHLCKVTLIQQLYLNTFDYAEFRELQIPLALEEPIKNTTKFEKKVIPDLVYLHIDWHFLQWSVF